MIRIQWIPIIVSYVKIFCHYQDIIQIELSIFKADWWLSKYTLIIKQMDPLLKKNIRLMFLWFFIVLIIVEPVFSEQVQVAVHLMIAFAIDALEAM